MTALRYLALGDSYTIGESVSTADRWPVQLCQALCRLGLKVAEPTLIATTGWTTDELLTGLDAADPEGPFDLVSLLIGVNDQYRGYSVEQFRRGLASLRLRAAQLADGKVDRLLMLSIPDWGITPFAAAEGRDAATVAREIDSLNAEIAAEAAAHGHPFVELTEVSRRAASEPDLLAADGLHPAGRMYALWVAQLLPVVERCLRA